MLKPRDHSTRWTLLLAGALALGASACSSDDDNNDAGADAGVQDTGAGGRDATVVDTGVAYDGGVVDSGPPPDGGHYCTNNGEVDVEGIGVPVADVAGTPLSSTGAAAVLSCIDSPPSENPPFITEFCFTECVNFLGATPTEAEIMALDIDVFPQAEGGNPVDPSYDHVSGLDRQPEAHTGAGFRFVPNTTDCDSGWQVELGYSDLGSVLNSETRYIVRVRTATSATQEWPATYLYNFIRRNDQNPDANCGNEEQRIPSRMFEFPVVPASLVDAAAAAATGTVEGTDDLYDGIGHGHALIEARDCAGGGGLTMSGVTSGYNPAPVDAFYLDEDYAVDSALDETSKVGLHMAVGFPITGSSTTSAVVTSAIGASTDGTCTEGFGGLTIPVFPDGVTLLRMNRETVVHGR